MSSTNIDQTISENLESKEFFKLSNFTILLLKNILNKQETKVNEKNVKMDSIMKLQNSYMLSPLSISISVLMSLLIIKNTSFINEIKNLFEIKNINTNYNKFNKENQELYKIKYIIQEMNNNQINIFNKVFVNINNSIDNVTKEMYLKYFNSSVNSLNFEDSVQSTKKINDWVFESSNGKLTNLLKSDAINKGIEYIFVNVVYFKNDWLYPFNFSVTKVENFYVSNNRISRVNMMKLENKKMSCLFNYKKKMNILSIPFKNKKSCMSILLPNISETVDDIIRLLTEEEINDILNNMDNFNNKQIVDLLLPKFKIRYKSDISKILHFQSKSVNKLKIIHQAYIDVNENGILATAATATTLLTASRLTNEKIKFICNRPFLFIIHDKKNIIFIGKFNSIL
jgi:serpin B